MSLSAPTDLPQAPELPAVKPSLPKAAAAAPAVPDAASLGLSPAPVAGPSASPLPPGSVAPLPPPTRPQIKAASAILIDAVSGQVLYGRNVDAPRPMASTTKIMTALLFCEAAPETAIVTASERAAATRESSLHLKKGETLTAHDLLRAMLLRSANDACVAAAEYVAGTEAAFAERMNAKAKELGCLHTHFVNSHGLHDDLHYTTAHDLALIARAAMQEPRIAETVCTQRCRINRSIDHNDVTLRNHSHFLGKFPGADGIKTGYTRPAGHCYVGSATEDGHRLISVVLRSPDYVGETSALMKFGFGRFAPHLLAKAGTPLASVRVENGAADEVQAVPKHDLQYLALKSEGSQAAIQTHFAPLTAPVIAGSPVGTADIVSDGKILSRSPLVAKDTVLANPDSLMTRSGGNFGARFLVLATIFSAGLVCLYYGKRNRNRTRPLAKSARRRRSRLT